MKVPKSKSNLSRIEASALLSETALFRKMLEEFTSLNEVHDKVDAEVLDEHVVHGDNEGMVNLIQYLLFQMQIFQAVMLKNDILPYAFHRIKLLGVPILNQEDFSEGALSNDIDHCEILKLNLHFCSPALKDDL